MRSNTEQAGHVVVVGQWREGHARLPLAYADSVAAAGGKPWIFSTFNLVPTETMPEELRVTTGLDVDDASPLDGACGLLIPGGGDIDPTLYGRRAHRLTKHVSHRRDRFELTLLEEALERDMPVLAICHGMQLLNVQLGGTLNQNLSDDPSKLDHSVGRPGPQPVHSLSIQPGTLLETIMGSEGSQVNSHHHQGLDDVSEDLEPVAWAPDGVLEAVVSRPHTWVVGVQWHPEVMAPTQPDQVRIFEAFVAAAHAYAQPGLSRSAARTA